MSSTTVWIDRATHARLAAFKDRAGAPSMAAAIRTLLDAPQETAKMIYTRRKRHVDAACRQHGVRRLIAFGSRARGDSAAGSDLDLSLQLGPDADAVQFLHAKAALEQAFACPTDIIGRPTHRPRLMQNIERDGVVLFAA